MWPEAQIKFLLQGHEVGRYNNMISLTPLDWHRMLLHRFNSKAQDYIGFFSQELDTSLSCIIQASMLFHPNLDHSQEAINIPASLKKFQVGF